MVGGLQLHIFRKGAGRQSEMIRNIFYIAAGGAAGGVCRYLLSLWINSQFKTLFPWSTFVVNFLACFLVGMFYGIASRNENFSSSLVLLLTTGFCGGFSTFSAFAYENMQLIRSGAAVYAFIYSTASILIGVAAVFLGFQIIK